MYVSVTLGNVVARFLASHEDDMRRSGERGRCKTEMANHPGGHTKLPKHPVTSHLQCLMCKFSQALLVSFLHSCEKNSGGEGLGLRSSQTLGSENSK